MDKKMKKPSEKEIERITNLFNKESVLPDTIIFKWVNNIIALEGFPKFSLKVRDPKEAINLIQGLLRKTFCLEEKLCALKYHMENIKELKNL